MKLLNGEIVNNIRIGESLYKIEFFSPYLSKNFKPGQFINIKCSSEESYDPFLRRPFSLYDIEENFNVVSVLYLIRGRGTRYLSSLEKGDEINFCGPLGNPINFENDKKVLLIGGGIGIAPLYLMAKKLADRGALIYFLSGYRQSNFRLLEKDFLRLSADYKIYCEDGTWQNTGIITDEFTKGKNKFKDYKVYCCGPTEMLKKLQHIFKDSDNEAIALLEEKMACGIGVCEGCAIKVKNKKGGFSYKKVCSDGPSFDLAEVIFD